MILFLLFAALVLMVLGGFAALLLDARPPDAGGRFSILSSKNVSRMAATTVVVCAILGSIPVIQVLLTGSTITIVSTPGLIPFVELQAQLDTLAAWFLLPTLGLSAVCAIYGVGYLRAWEGRRALGPVWFFYTLLVFGICLVLLARNAVLFLYAWEIMAIASYFLVTFEHQREEVREAGWIYLVATHLGTAFLLILFLSLSHQTGSLNFGDWAQNSSWAQRSDETRHLAGILFLVALIGFGTKAGLMPFHVWLPEAHPAAPSHVSALMSGVMIKTGIYGLLRSLSFLGPPEPWWGWVLLGIGLASGVIGIVFALAQHDLKRLLAYSSVENVGLVAVGLGLGVLGIAYHVPALAVLGFAGGLIHAFNHSLFKGLLFLAAGAVAHSTGTRQMDQLGGLLKKMRWTGFAFLFGGIAICGLPPLNGFIGEWLLVSASLAGMNAQPALLSPSPQSAIAGLMALIGLGLIGGFAAATFTKAFGIVFLGEPRKSMETKPHEVGAAMRVPMLLLAGACVVVVAAGPGLLRLLAPALARMADLQPEWVVTQLQLPSAVLGTVALCGCLLVLVSALLFIVRGGLLAGREIGSAGTWGCGYLRPTARMQYTAASFSQPIAALFKWLLGMQQHGRLPEGIFPSGASLSTETPDLCHGNLYHPAFLKANWGLSKLRWLQRGQVQLYVLYIAVTLIVLLVWKFQ